MNVSELNICFISQTAKLNVVYGTEATEEQLIIHLQKFVRLFKSSAVSKLQTCYKSLYFNADNNNSIFIIKTGTD